MEDSAIVNSQEFSNTFFFLVDFSNSFSRAQRKFTKHAITCVPFSYLHNILSCRGESVFEHNGLCHIDLVFQRPNLITVFGDLEQA